MVKVLAAPAGETVDVVWSEMLPNVAVKTDEPASTPRARPPADTVATEVELEVQVTEEVMSCVLPSE